MAECAESAVNSNCLHEPRMCAKLCESYLYEFVFIRQVNSFAQFAAKNLICVYLRNSAAMLLSAFSAKIRGNFAAFNCLALLA
jgi:hypothetical protein